MDTYTEGAACARCGSDLNEREDVPVYVRFKTRQRGWRFAFFGRFPLCLRCQRQIEVHKGWYTTGPGKDD